MISEEKLTIGIFTRSKLLSDAHLGSLVGNKIYPGISPENTPSPFIIYERDSYNTESTKFGVYKEEAEITYEVVSDDYDTGLDIAVAMRRILQGKHQNGVNAIGEPKYLTYEIILSREYYMEQKFRQLLIFKIS